MDAEGNIIPIVDDDQGEGFRDIFEGDMDEMQRIVDEQRERSMQRQRDFTNKGKRPNPFTKG